MFNRAAQREAAQKRREATRQAKESRRIERQMIAALRKEAQTYCQLFIDKWSKRGSAHFARSASVATDGKPVKPGRKVQRVRIEKIKTQAERISIKIMVSKRTLFGPKTMLPYGVDVADLISREALFELSAACDRVVKFDEHAFKKNKGVWIHVYRLEGLGGIPAQVNFRETLQHYPADMSRTPIFLGIGENRTVHMADLTSTPHVLIGGTTGGGKSNMIKNIISALIRFMPPSELKLALVDFKSLEFAFYEGLPHLYRPVVNDPQAAMELLDDLLKEMGERIAVMKGHATDIAEWNAAHPDRAFPRIVVIVDEFAELSLSEDKKIKDRTLLLIARFTALGRAIGMHFIACTQRPAAEIMPMTIKGNMPLVISGPVPSQHHSMTMLGTGDAARIEKVPGRMIFKANLDIQQIQTPLVTADDRREAIRIARGRAVHVINLEGIDPVIDPVGLLRFLIQNESGSLAADLVDRILCEFAINRRMFKAFVTDLVKQGQIVDAAGDVYEVKRNAKGYRLLLISAAPVVATEDPGPTNDNQAIPPVVVQRTPEQEQALQFLRSQRLKKEVRVG